MDAFRSSIVCARTASAAFAVVAASVQAAPDHARRDPANPQADVPAVSYRSPLSEFRRIGEQPVGSWRALNDQVRAIGGWRAYAREANAPEAADKAPPAPPPKDAAPANPAAPPASPGAHGGHSGMPKER
jgi:hypothetical protein